MTNEEAKKMLKAKLECLIRETSRTDRDCNYKDCDECNLCYEQGNMGEQKEALELAIKALDQEPKTAHWIVAKGDSYLGVRNACCSNCKDFYTNDWDYMNYCPNCGARMIEK